MATLEQARSIVDKLERELNARAAEADKARGYYQGKHPLQFASDQFRNYFGSRYEGFSDNWTQVVADSPMERLNPIGIRLADDDKSGDTDLWNIWRRNGADSDAPLAFHDAITTKRSYGLVWVNDDDPDTPEITFESSAEAVVAYAPGSRRKRTAGLKLWRDEDREYATLYLPDEVWRFVRSQSIPEVTASGLYTVVDLRGPEQWQLRDVDEGSVVENPLGVVPMVEFQNRPLLNRDPLSDVQGVMSMQDAINLLWAQLFTASDFASFKQRVVLGAERPKLPILNEQGQVVGEEDIPLEKFAVDRVVWLEDPNSKIDEWSATDLEVWTKVIEVAVGHIAAQTRTPQHYLIGKMANLSGDALKAAETGLVKRTEEKQLHFGESLREMFRLVCLAQGNEAKARQVQDGSVQWADAESRSEAQLMDALAKAKDIGFPFQWIAERYGLSPTEVARVMDMRKRDLERLMVDPSLMEGPKSGISGSDGGGAGSLPAAEDAGESER